MNGNANSHASKTFSHVENPEILLPVLRQRLPRSSSVYNMVKSGKDFRSGKLDFYTIGHEIGLSTWILAIFMRDDYVCDISVSAPKGQGQVDQNIRDAFINTDLIDWSKPYIFANIDKEISHFFIDLSVTSKGNSVTIYPCNYYAMSEEKARNIVLNEPSGGGFEIRSLKDDNVTEFFIKTWKFAVDGSDKYVEEMLKKNPSCGIFVPGQNEPVSGVLSASYGLLAMLFTDKKYRGKGYGYYAMQYAMKEVGLCGRVPCCTVEIRNDVSNAFMKKNGLEMSHLVDFIFHRPVGWAKE